MLGAGAGQPGVEKCFRYQPSCIGNGRAHSLEPARPELDSKEPKHRRAAGHTAGRLEGHYMKEELGTAGAIVGATALVLLFGGLALAVYPGWDVIGIWFNTRDMPAWVQAVGSVLALLVALGVAAWQTGRARALAAAERLERALVTVQTIGVLIDLYAAEVASVNAAIGKPRNEVGDYLSRMTPENQFSSIERYAQAIPLHDLPDVASAQLTIALMNNIQTTRAAVSVLKTAFEDGEGDWAAILYPLRPQVESARDLQIGAKSAVERVGNKPRR